MTLKLSILRCFVGFFPPGRWRFVDLEVTLRTNFKELLHSTLPIELWTQPKLRKSKAIFVKEIFAQTATEL